jgi:hypothetical protein
MKNATDSAHRPPAPRAPARGFPFTIPPSSFLPSWIPAFAGMTFAERGWWKIVTPAKAVVQLFLAFLSPALILHSSFLTHHSPFIAVLELCRPVAV